MIWNRDVNVSKNILDISFSVWRGEARPKYLQEIDTEETVSPSPVI